MNGKDVTQTVIEKGRKKKHCSHDFPKMSPEAQIALQEIRALDTKSYKTTTKKKSTELPYDSLLPQTTIKMDKKQFESDSINDFSTKSTDHQSPDEYSNEVACLEEEFPFVITFPGFDIRYSLTALRPRRESPEERERNVCLQRKSIAKCKEWLKRC